MNQEQKENLIRFLEDRDHLDVTGNALLVKRNGQELFRHFSGDSTPETLYRIYSMTKVVTVTAALQLYEKGMFTMEDLLGDYIPEYKNVTVWDGEKAVPAQHPIRIRDLFCMSAGLTYEGDWGETPRRLKAIRAELEKACPGESYSTLDYVRRIPEAPLAFEPGTHWNYSLCHDVLGGLIEVLSGETLGEYMKHHIFEPLGMKHTFFRCPAELKDRMAPNGDDGNDAKFGPNARYEAGGGGLLSTADDYMRLAETLTRMGTSEDGVRILGRKTVELMRMDQLDEELKKDFNWDYLKGYSYGLGVRTLKDPALAGIAGSKGEFGWCGVLGTWVLMDPEEKLTVVYMHQRYPNLEKYVQTHLRAMIYAAI